MSDAALIHTEQQSRTTALDRPSAARAQRADRAVLDLYGQEGIFVSKLVEMLISKKAKLFAVLRVVPFSNPPSNFLCEAGFINHYEHPKEEERGNHNEAYEFLQKTNYKTAYVEVLRQHAPEVPGVACCKEKDRMVKSSGQTTYVEVLRQRDSEVDDQSEGAEEVDQAGNK